MVGALLWGLTYERVFPSLSAVANLGGVTLPEAFGVELWLMIALFVVVALTLFYFLERYGQLRRDRAQ